MPVEPNKTDDLILLPMPLTALQIKSEKRNIVEDLKKNTLEEIIEQELALIYSWPLMEYSSTKRLYRNYELVYSTDELKKFLLNTYKIILANN